MRDYRTISAAEFVAECIEMKLRWLARQLRWVDKPAEIEAWVSSVTAITNLLWKIKDQPSTGNGEVAMGKVFRKNGRPAGATKLVKDKARVRAQDRTEISHLRDNNRIEEGEKLVEVQDGDDERARITPPSRAIEDSTWVDNVGNIELQCWKEKGIMVAKKKAVLKMLASDTRII